MSGRVLIVDGCRWAPVDSRAKIVGLMGAALAVSAAPTVPVLGVQLGLIGGVNQGWGSSKGSPLLKGDRGIWGSG